MSSELAVPVGKRAENQDILLVCGYGSLPLEIANGAVAAGRSPFLVGIVGEAPAEISRFPHEFLSWGQVGRLFRILKEKNIREVVFAGGIHSRPDLWKLRLDWGTFRVLPEALAFILAGDNTVLSGLIKMFEKRGIAVSGAHEIAPSIIAGAGLIAGPKPSARDLANIKLAFSACKALGTFDIGQAAVAEGARIVAVEAVEGTDALLARIVALRESGRMPPKGKSGVLVKAMKPGQEMRADLPAIGPATVMGVKAAGLHGIAIEANCAIILEREKTLEAANSAGIYIFGYTPETGEPHG